MSSLALQRKYSPGTAGTLGNMCSGLQTVGKNNPLNFYEFLMITSSNMEFMVGDFCDDGERGQLPAIRNKMMVDSL